MTSNTDWPATSETWSADRSLEREAFETLFIDFTVTQEVIAAALAADVVTSTPLREPQIIKGAADSAIAITTFLAANDHARAVALQHLDLSESTWDRSRLPGRWAEGPGVRHLERN